MPCNAEETSVLHGIAQGNDFYNQKQYQQAADIYERIASQGFENTYLYYNLGNAYYRLGNMGKAIMNYQRARNLAPRFEDIDANLRYAIAETEDKLSDPPPPFVKNIIFWMDNFSRLEYAQGILAINLLFWLTAAVSVIKRTNALGIVKKTLLFLLVLATISAGAKFYADTTHQSGVVLDNRIDIKSGQGADNVTLFQLHAGAIINITETHGDWYKIEISEEKKGWAHKKSIGIV